MDFPFLTGADLGFLANFPVGVGELELLLLEESSGFDLDSSFSLTFDFPLVGPPPVTVPFFPLVDVETESRGATPLPEEFLESLRLKRDVDIFSGLEGTAFFNGCFALPILL